MGSGGALSVAAGGGCEMKDIVFVLITIAFFGVALAYVYGCEKLK